MAADDIKPDQDTNAPTTPKDEHKGANASDPRVNLADNPDKQEPEADNPLSVRRSDVPTEESEAPSINNRSHGDRPKIARGSAEDHR